LVFDSNPEMLDYPRDIQSEYDVLSYWILVEQIGLDDYFVRFEKFFGKL